MIDWKELQRLEVERKTKKIARLKEENKELFDKVGDSTFPSMRALAIWYCNTNDVDGITLFKRKTKYLTMHNRNIIILLYCLFDKASTNDIGRFVGRDHTTVLYHLGDLKCKQGRRKKPNEILQASAFAGSIGECFSDSRDG